MTPLPGLNLIFHSIRQGGGMERHVLDLIAYATGQGMQMNVVTRDLSWPGVPPLNATFVVVPDRTPFARVNTFFFEYHALKRCRADWPTISISRVPGADMAIVGGTHIGHLHDRGKKRIGFFDRQTIAREQAMYLQAQVIVAHSGKVAKEIVHHYGLDPKKISTLYPPVDTAVFNLQARAERDDVRRTLGIASNQLMLLFPSNNHTLKGADLILEALDGFDSRIRLVVAGKAPLNAPDTINLGFRQDMPALYAASDAVILASHYEAFGLVGPEAVLCGTPALFANTVGAAEVLADEACLRFERSVPSLRLALNKALERFELGTLSLSNPGRYIQYPYSVAQHFNAVLSLLGATIQK